MDKLKNVTLELLRALDKSNCKFSLIKDINESLWSDNQLKIHDAMSSLLSCAFNRRKFCIDTYSDFCRRFFSVAKMSVSNPIVKEKIYRTALIKNRKLTLQEKHVIRDEQKLAELELLTEMPVEELKKFFKAQDELQTGGRIVLLVVNPEGASKKKKSSNRIEVKTNTKYSNPNVTYGYFQKVQTDKNGKVFVLIRNMTRELVGEKAKASISKFGYSQIPVARIDKFYAQSGNMWIDLSTDEHRKVDNVWSEVDKL